MSSEQDQKKITEDKILKILENMRLSKRKESAEGAVPELVELLEDVSSITSIKDPLQSQLFLDAYVIEIIQKYVLNPYGQELLLVTYGLLEDFTIDVEESIVKRRKMYCNRALDNKLISQGWDNISQSFYKEEKKLMEPLAKRLAKETCIVEGQDNYLGLGEPVAKKLIEEFPNGFPNRYPYPKPKYIPNYQPFHSVMEVKSTQVPRLNSKPQDTLGASFPSNSSEPEIGKPPDSNINKPSTPIPLWPNLSGRVPTSPYIPPVASPLPPYSPTIKKMSFQIKKIWDRIFYGTPISQDDSVSGNQADCQIESLQMCVLLTEIIILFSVSIATTCLSISEPPNDRNIERLPVSLASEIITSANPNNEVNLTREQFIVRDDDMSTIINDAREPIVLYTESGDYDVEAMRELIYERIVNNPIYGDMIIRGIMEADSFSRDQIGPHNSWMKRFLEETNVAEDKAKTYDPYMGQWLIKAGNLVSTNDDYKNYAGFLCGVLNYFDTSGGVYDFKSTCCWSIDANASGTHAHAERVDGNSVKSALVFRSGFMNGETGYILAFSLEDGSLLFHNPWMWGVDSFLMEETPGMISAGWGDSGSGRPSYTSEEVAAGALGDKIVFNSISNGYIGDEKNFVGARNETDLADNPYGYYEGNYIHVEDGKEYRVRLYVHNNNPGGERTTAENVRVGFGIPWVTARNIAVNGFLSSSNAYPDEYWDGVVLMADQNFHLEYVEGSAIFENGGFASTRNGGPKPLSDDIVTDPEGILIGYSDYDGQIPGGREYECAVSLLVKAVFDSEDLLESKVRTLGADTWNDDVEVDVGNILEFRVRYENISYDDVIHSDVLLQAALPEGLEYMDGSAFLYSKDNSIIGQIDMGTFIADGINIGNYASGEGAYILYNAKVVKGNLPDGYNKIINWASCSVNKKSIADYSTATLYKTE